METTKSHPTVGEAAAKLERRLKEADKSTLEEMVVKLYILGHVTAKNAKDDSLWISKMTALFHPDNWANEEHMNVRKMLLFKWYSKSHLQGRIMEESEDALGEYSDDTAVATDSYNDEEEVNEAELKKRVEQLVELFSYPGDRRFNQRRVNAKAARTAKAAQKVKAAQQADAEAETGTDDAEVGSDSGRETILGDIEEDASMEVEDGVVEEVEEAEEVGEADAEDNDDEL